MYICQVLKALLFCFNCPLWSSQGSAMHNAPELQEEGGGEYVWHSYAMRVILPNRKSRMESIFTWTWFEIRSSISHPSSSEFNFFQNEPDWINWRVYIKFFYSYQFFIVNICAHVNVYINMASVRKEEDYTFILNWRKPFALVRNILYISTGLEAPQHPLGLKQQGFGDIWTISLSLQSLWKS